MNIGSLVATLGADISQLRKAVDQAEGAIKRYDQTVNRELGQAQRRWRTFGARVSGIAKNLNAKLHSFGEGLKKRWLAIAAAATAVVYGLKKLGSSFVDAASTAENLKLRMVALLRSTKEGTQAFKDMATFAAKVPFEYKNIMEAATAFAGVMKGGREEINKWMPVLTDLAAAAGLTLRDTTSNFIKMYSAGAAAADMFRERGILAMLGFKAGAKYTAEETRKTLIEAWKDPASKFRGLTKELAKTWTGLVSMLSDAWFQFRTNVMDRGPFDYLKAALSLLLKKIQELKEQGRLDEWAQKVADNMIAAGKAIAFVAAGIADLVRWLRVAIYGLRSLKEMVVSLPGFAEGFNKLFGTDLSRDKALDNLDKFNEKIYELVSQSSAIGKVKDFFKEIEEEIEKLKAAEKTKTGLGILPGYEFSEEARKMFKEHEKAYTDMTDRLKQATLEDYEYRIWQLNRWYSETINKYQRVAKELEQSKGMIAEDVRLERVQKVEEGIVKATKIYNAEKLALDRECYDKRREEYNKFADEYQALEREISLDLMTESQRRVAQINWEAEERMAALERLQEAGVITEALMLQLMAKAADAANKAIEDIKDKSKTTADYLEEMNKQCARNIQQSWSGLISGVMKGEFDSFGDWFNSFLNSLYDTWADTLAKMAYKWISDFVNKISSTSGTTTGGGGGGGGGWWGNLLGGLVQGIIGVLGQGGVVKNNRIMQFARGGIANKPTLFPMAEGYGLMAEQAPEAVMPLARTSRGELGVKVAGDEGKRGEIIINGPLMQVTTPNADSFRKSQNQIMADMTHAINRSRRNT